MLPIQTCMKHEGSNFVIREIKMQTQVIYKNFIIIKKIWPFPKTLSTIPTTIIWF